MKRYTSSKFHKMAARCAALCLAFSILFSFPLIAFADTEFICNDFTVRRYGNGNGYIYNHITGSPPYTFSSVGASADGGFTGDCNRLSFIALGNFSCDKNDNINFKLNGNFKMFSHFDNIAVKISNNDGVTIFYQTVSNVTVNNNGNSNLFDINDSARIKYSGNVTIAINCTGGTLYDYYAYNTINAFNIETTDNNSSLLNSIITIINNIKTSIQNLPGTIGGFISSATAAIQTSIDSIESWLTTVKNGIVTAVNNIQTWLTNLGTTIGGFFSNIWTSISTKWTTFWNDLSDSLTNFKNSVSTFFINLGDRIKSFFIPSSTFWDDYKEDWLDFLELHFSGIFIVVDSVSELWDSITDLFSYEQSGDFYIIFPKLSFNTGGVNVTLNDRSLHSFDELISTFTHFRFQKYNAATGTSLFNFWTIWDAFVSGTLMLLAFYFLKKKFTQFMSSYGGD